jgi:uncharacterized membrane protein
MPERVKYPRVLAVVRAALYLVAAVVVVGIIGVAVASLVLVFGVGVVALLLNGDVNVLAMAGLFGLVVLTLGVLVAGLVTGVRRIDDAVQEAARDPGPVERLKQRYVNAEFDEAELERRLADLLDGERAEDSEAVGGGEAGTVEVDPA